MKNGSCATNTGRSTHYRRSPITPTKRTSPPTRDGNSDPTTPSKLRIGQARQSTHKAYYEKLRVAISFTRWLHENDLTLEQTRQAQLDHWLTGPPSRALPTRAFLDWAHTAGLIPALHIARPPARISNTPINHATRLQQARALLHDDDVEPRPGSPARCCCSTASS